MTSEDRELLEAGFRTIARALTEGLVQVVTQLREIDESLCGISEHLETIEKQLKEIDGSILDRGL